MAIIKCPECGKEISDQAEYCINCGYPLSEIQQTTYLSQYNDNEVIEAYDVMLVDYGNSKFKTISDLVDILQITRSQARELLSTLPVYIYNDIPKGNAEYLARRLQLCNIRIAVYDPVGNVRYFEPPTYVNRPLPVVAPIPRPRRIVQPSPIRLFRPAEPKPSPIMNHNPRPQGGMNHNSKPQGGMKNDHRPMDNKPQRKAFKGK